ncbi:MAG: hypothetical protein GC185_07790 [Alphaproteobacteria bacterium]|nr:hypothetical protein [Alphaproteobacteria bacterium]
MPDTDMHNENLIAVAGTDNVQDARALVSQGADVNHVDADGNFPLMIAVTKGQNGMIGCLLELDADPDKATKSGLTALHQAVNKNDIGAVRQLIAAGASLEPPGAGVTPEELARKTGADAIADLLSGERLRAAKEEITAQAAHKAEAMKKGLAKDTAVRKPLKIVARKGHTV